MGFPRGVLPPKVKTWEWSAVTTVRVSDSLVSCAARWMALSNITVSVKASLAMPSWWPWSILPRTEGEKNKQQNQHPKPFQNPFFPHVVLVCLRVQLEMKILLIWYSSSTNRKYPLGFLLRIWIAFSVISTMEGSRVLFRNTSNFMSFGSNRPRMKEKKSAQSSLKIDCGTVWWKWWRRCKLTGQENKQKWGAKAKREKSNFTVKCIPSSLSSQHYNQSF